MNNVILTGRLTKDPEIRYSQSGTAVARYTLAVDRYRDECADFITCKAFGKVAEFAEKHLAKGKKICIAGHIETGSYTKKNGERVYTTEVVVEQHEFLEPRKQDKPIEMPPQDDGFMYVPDGLEGDGLPFN